MSPYHWRMTPQPLDALDQRIIGALMIDGRATWRAIAEVLEVPERTVMRRGRELIENATVTIHAMADPHRTGKGDPYLVFGSSAPGRSWNVAAALARRPETKTAYSLLGRKGYFCDIWCPEQRRATFFNKEMAEIPGLGAVTVVPVLRYIRTLHDWDPALLTARQIDALKVPTSSGHWPQFTEPVRLSSADRTLIKELTTDGRRSYEELARLCGVSEQTVGRKVAALRENQLLSVRAVFDPALIGRPVAVFLWLRVRPERVQKVSDLLAAEAYVRYAAVTIGEFQIAAELRLSSKAELLDVVTQAAWMHQTESMDSSIILEVLKQSEVLSPELQ